MNAAAVAVVILAGGRATRFPGKLEANVEGEPLLVRVYRNVRDAAPVVIAGAGTFPSTLDAQLDCPIVVDRWPNRGPLGGLLSACSELNAQRIFAVAGDAPRVTSTVMDRLLEAWQDGDEAAVPEHDGALEPLAGVYERDALLREGFGVLNGERASMHALLERLRVRTVPMPGDFFLNINTTADLI